MPPTGPDDTAASDLDAFIMLCRLQFWPFVYESVTYVTQFLLQRHLQHLKQNYEVKISIWFWIQTTSKFHSDQFPDKQWFLQSQGEHCVISQCLKKRLQLAATIPGWELREQHLVSWAELPAERELCKNKQSSRKIHSGPWWKINQVLLL